MEAVHYYIGIFIVLAVSLIILYEIPQKLYKWYKAVKINYILIREAQILAKELEASLQDNGQDGTKGNKR